MGLAVELDNIETVTRAQSVEPPQQSRASLTDRLPGHGAGGVDNEQQLSAKNLAGGCRRHDHGHQKILALPLLTEQRGRRRLVVSGPPAHNYIPVHQDFPLFRRYCCTTTLQLDLQWVAGAGHLINRQSGFDIQLNGCAVTAGVYVIRKHRERTDFIGIGYLRCG